VSAAESPRLPLPPFDPQTAAQKVRMAEDAWNTRDPVRVALAYTPDSAWRNRSKFLTGRESIQPPGRRPDHPGLSDLGL